MNESVVVTSFKGVSKKTKKPYEALKLEIGDWSTLVFPRSKFEMQYVKEQLGIEDDEK